MPAIVRFAGKLPESADYRVAGIVSYPRRIHKKERSFNSVIFEMGDGPGRKPEESVRRLPGCTPAAR
jgi:hypothetical protein